MDVLFYHISIYTMIKVGINENVVIKSVGIESDKNRLFIELEEAGTVQDLFAAQTATGYASEGGTSMKLNLLSILAPKPDSQKTADQNITLVNGDVNRLRNQLTQILEQFMLQKDIDLGAVQYLGTGIVDTPSLKANILRQDVLDKIYSNLSRRFVELFNALGPVGQTPVRFKLIRQSKEKHYASIPSRFIADRPFIELASIPGTAAKVKFTEYEIKEGLADGTPVSADKAAEAKGTLVPGANPFTPAPAANSGGAPVNPFAPPTQAAAVESFAVPAPVAVPATAPVAAQVAPVAQPFAAPAPAPASVFAAPVAAPAVQAVVEQPPFAADVAAPIPTV